MNDTPKVSVIIPVWNPGDGIVRCVASLRNQTLKDVEMLFVDDRGTDGAMDVVRAAAAEDPRIRIITNSGNLGAGASRNAAIEVARGEYLGFVDADDYVDVDFLEILYTKGKAEGLDIVKGGFVKQFDDGTMAPANFQLNAQIRYGLHRNAPLFSLFRFEFQSALYHSRLVANPSVRFGLTAIGEDSTYLLKACHFAKTFGIDDGTSYKLVFREASATNVTTNTNLVARLAAIREQAAFLSSHDVESPYAVAYVLKKTQYYLFIQRHASLIHGMEDEAARFLSSLRNLVVGFPGLAAIKEKELDLYALVECGVNLADMMSYVAWGKTPIADYASFVSDWSAFIASHPECKSRYFDGYSWLLEELYMFVLDMDSMGYGIEEKVRMKTLSRQVFSDLCCDGDQCPPDEALTDMNFLLFALKEQAAYLGSLSEEDAEGMKYWIERLKRFLSLQRLVGNREGMGEDAARFLSGLRGVARDFPRIKAFMEDDLPLFALVEYGENLAECPYRSPWSKPKAREYAELVAAWNRFLEAHPECKAKYLDGYARFLVEFCSFVKRMRYLGYSASEIVSMEALCREMFSDKELDKEIPFNRRAWNCAAGIWPMECLAHLEWDCERLRRFVRYHIDKNNQQLANREVKGACEHEIKANLGRMLRLTQEIQDWARSEPDVGVRGIYDYGVLLSDGLWAEYSTATGYTQMFYEWRAFFATHPDCEVSYDEAYNRFLDRLCEFVMDMGSQGYPTEEVGDMRTVCRCAFSDEGLKARVRPAVKHFWYCAAGVISINCIPPDSWDFGKLNSHLQYRLNECNRLMTLRCETEARAVLDNLGRMLRLTPEIKAWAESVPDVGVRGVYDYRVALRSLLWGDYRTIPDYAQMLKNWREFLTAHPACEYVYLIGYRGFLKDAKRFIGDGGQGGCSAKEAEEWKKALASGWRGLPFRVRARSKAIGLKGIVRRVAMMFHG